MFHHSNFLCFIFFLQKSCTSGRLYTNHLCFEATAFMASRFLRLRKVIFRFRILISRRKECKDAFFIHNHGLTTIRSKCPSTKRLMTDRNQASWPWPDIGNATFSGRNLFSRKKRAAFSTFHVPIETAWKKLHEVNPNTIPPQP